MRVTFSPRDLSLRQRDRGATWFVRRSAALQRLNPAMRLLVSLRARSTAQQGDFLALSRFSMLAVGSFDRTRRIKAVALILGRDDARNFNGRRGAAIISDLASNAALGCGCGLGGMASGRVSLLRGRYGPN